MDKESEKVNSPTTEKVKVVVKKKRKRRKHKESLWVMLKRSTIWGIAIGVAFFAVIFAIISYNW